MSNHGSIIAAEFEVKVREKLKFLSGLLMRQTVSGTVFCRLQNLKFRSAMLYIEV